MTPAPSFQRARQPEQITLRREQLLAAAAELFDAEGPSGTGLNAIAARAGFTKSNVYRYFESREQVLLEMFREEFVKLVDAMVDAIGVASDVPALADAISTTFLAHPRCCSLMAILANTLEQNVSEDTIATTKLHMDAQNTRLIAALKARLPGATPTDCGWAIFMIGTLLVGMWPNTNPPPAARAVLARPEFAHLRMDLSRDLTRAAEALLQSIA
ncbi:TetR family transcriptional regulator [Devosia pacifica]|uniref:TetR family transcriptional regulator n=1 Tax=Devosia pacifica TaxID=1335967 RepID=A0A918SG95_9HYPH|nr:TetR family transcriptional regulator [Devosia pacifica]GHA37171.1 TetR family transcriptional regulator [Devosia pacifica]